MKKKNIPDVSVIIPTLNRPKKLNNCIKSILESDFKDIEIIIVFDGVSIDYKKYDYDDRIICIFNEARKGLAYSRNIGISNSKSNLLLFIDDDNVVHPKMISNLILNISKNSYSILSPLTFYHSNQNYIWFAGAKLNMYTSKFNFFFKNKIYNSSLKLDRIIISDIVHNCFMVDKVLFKKFGKFDESLFVSGTELDFCFRAKVESRIGIVTSAKCYHDIPKNKSSNFLRILGFIDKKRVFYGARNKIIIMARYSKPKTFFVFIFIFLPIIALKNIFILIWKAKIKYILLYLNGLLNGLKYLIRNGLSNN